MVIHEFLMRVRLFTLGNFLSGAFTQDRETTKPVLATREKVTKFVSARNPDQGQVLQLGLIEDSINPCQNQQRNNQASVEARFVSSYFVSHVLNASYKVFVKFLNTLCFYILSMPNTLVSGRYRRELVSKSILKILVMDLLLIPVQICKSIAHPSTTMSHKGGS